ncbi:MAG: outer membrane protein assembly factor BamB [Pseudomonadota bacterium]
MSVLFRPLRWGAVACVTLALAGCGSGPKKPDPKPLEPIASPIAGRVVWQQSLDKVTFPLHVASQDDVFALATSNGTVLAVQADTGTSLWRAEVGEALGAGVGFDGRSAAVVTLKGDVVVVQPTGVVWRRPVGVQVATAPLVAGERVFVLGSDRSVHAYDVQDGRKLWALQRQGDPLTLLQPGVLRPFGNTLVVGQGPRMVGLDSLKGSVTWETSVASPRGTNEIERLADLVGPAARVGEFVCARSFQSAIGCVNAARGALAWSKNFGGTLGLAADADQVYAADAADRIQTWKTTTGLPLWTSDALANHGLTAPAIAGPLLIFGDARGMVHVLSRDDGRALLRLATDGSPIVATPTVSGTTVLVVTRKGGLFALRPE